MAETAEMKWKYEKLDENYKLKWLPTNDTDGKITGKIVMNVPAYFDENPEERKRLGWIKHYYYKDPKEMRKDYPDYDPATQYAVKTVQTVDEYTVKDVYHFIEKTDEMMVLEEMLEMTEMAGHSVGNMIIWEGDEL